MESHFCSSGTLPRFVATPMLRHANLCNFYLILKPVGGYQIVRLRDPQGGFASRVSL